MDSKDNIPKLLKEKIEQNEKILKGDPKNLGAHIRISRAYQEAGIIEKAIFHLEEAIKLKPDDNYLKFQLDRLVNPDKMNETAFKGLFVETGKPISEKEVKKWTTLIYTFLGIISIIVIFFLVKIFIFPTTYKIAGSDKETVYSAKWSPKGDKIAYLVTPKKGLVSTVQSVGQKEDVELKLVEKRGKNEKTLYKTASYSHFAVTFSWSPKGDKIALDVGKYANSIIYIITLDGIVEREIKGGMSPTWSPDGKKIAYISSGITPQKDRENFNPFVQNFNFDTEDSFLFDPNLYIIDLENGEVTKVTQRGASNPYWSSQNYIIYQSEQAISFSSTSLQERLSLLEDGVIPHSEGFNSQIYSVEPNTGFIKELTDEGDNRLIKVSPSGKYILFTKQKLTFEETQNDQTFLSEIWIMNMDGSSKKKLLDIKDVININSISFSYNEKFIAYEGFLDTINKVSTYQGMALPITIKNKDIFIISLENENYFRFKNKHQFKSNPEFSPIGNFLLYQIKHIDAHTELWVTKIKI